MKGRLVRLCQSWNLIKLGFVVFYFRSCAQAVQDPERRRIRYNNFSAIPTSAKCVLPRFTQLGWVVVSNMSFLPGSLGTWFLLTNISQRGWHQQNECCDDFWSVWFGYLCHGIYGTGIFTISRHMSHQFCEIVFRFGKSLWDWQILPLAFEQGTYKDLFHGKLQNGEVLCKYVPHEEWSALSFVFSHLQPGQFFWRNGSMTRIEHRSGGFCYVTNSHVDPLPAYTEQEWVHSFKFARQCRMFCPTCGLILNCLAFLSPGPHRGGHFHLWIYLQTLFVREFAETFVGYCRRDVWSERRKSPCYLDGRHTC